MIPNVDFWQRMRNAIDLDERQKIKYYVLEIVLLWFFSLLNINSKSHHCISHLGSISLSSMENVRNGATRVDGGYFYGLKPITE